MYDVMSYRLECDESVQESVQRIAGEQIDKALDITEDSAVDVERTVHEVRKRCKKIRALLRFARPSFEETYSRENAFFRDAARQLSQLRDATSRIECLDELRQGLDSKSTALDVVRGVLVQSRNDLYESDDVEKRFARFQDGLRAACARLSTWALDATGFDAFGPGVKKTYKRGRKAMAVAYDEGSTDAFHEWRKRVKYHRYHVRLLRNLWEPVLEVRRDLLHDLTDLLGAAHDLAVLRTWLVESRDRFGSAMEPERVLSLADVRRKELGARALPLGRRLFADKPKWWCQRSAIYWEGWKMESEPARELMV